MLVRIWRKWDTSVIFVGMEIDAVTVDSSIEIPQKIKNGSAF